MTEHSSETPPTRLQAPVTIVHRQGQGDRFTMLALVGLGGGAIFYACKTQLVSKKVSGWPRGCGETQSSGAEGVPMRGSTPQRGLSLFMSCRTSRSSWARLGTS